jgi:UDP-N-acetylglucosamine diphosphorylase/glucosamine-1-phosphate N-acetyltransferase
LKTKDDDEMIVALFEDESYENFYPIAHTRPVFECKSGMFTILERAQKLYPEATFHLFTRDYIVPILSKRVTATVNEPNSIDDELLLINGTLIMEEKTKRLIAKKLSKNTLMMQNGRIALASVSKDLARKHGEDLCRPLTNHAARKLMKECKCLEAEDLPLLSYPWDLVNKNSELIKQDYSAMTKEESEGTVDDKSTIYGSEESVHVGEGSFVEAHVTLDARDGPIFIGNETTVHAGSRITGPSFIGDKTIIPTGLIREGCSIGPVCRVGGELEETIIQGYTNKYHTGFIGHAYIGEWVNLGAATTNSDLKNTYGTVQVATKGKNVDTGTTKVGCFIGDHAKTSIGTQIYTGKKIGVASQVHGVVTKDVPAFTMWSGNFGAKPVELYLQSAIDTQKRVLSQRGVKQTREDIELLKELFQITTQERKIAGVVKRKFTL